MGAAAGLFADAQGTGKQAAGAALSHCRFQSLGFAQAGKPPMTPSNWQKSATDKEADRSRLTIIARCMIDTGSVPCEQDTFSSAYCDRYKQTVPGNENKTTDTILSRG